MADLSPSIIAAFGLASSPRRGLFALIASAVVTMAAMLGTVLAVLCPGILALVSRLQVDRQRRAAAERALEVPASTDPRTRLANRRRFVDGAEARCRC